MAYVDHLSYSSLTLFCADRLAFKKRYILNQRDSDQSPTAVVGKGCHKAVEMVLKGMNRQDSILEGKREMDKVPDNAIRYGSQISCREDLNKRFNQAIGFYLAEMPELNKPINIEQKINERIYDRNGNELPLPAVSIPDIVDEEADGRLTVYDHKFIYQYSDFEKDKATYVLQALFNFHTIESKYGKAPWRMIFRECKVSKNSDGSQQVREYEVIFAQQPDLFAVFYNIYNDVCRELSKPDIQFLPNFRDMFTGQDSFDVYRQGILPVGTEDLVEVSHKRHDKKIVQRTYVPSALDEADNESLTNEEKIRLKLGEFGVEVEMKETHIGASITQYTMRPDRATRMASIKKLEDDLKYALGVPSLRIEAPIKGQRLVGVEVPSEIRQTVDLTDEHLLMGTLTLPIGVDVRGNMVYKDLAAMPHLLIAGATGSGKSVAINVFLTALTRQMTPEQMKLVLIDPKRVELAQFANQPHLISDVIYDVEDATKTLQWLVDEMNSRYEILQHAHVRQIDDYAGGMPRIVVVIDEFADLMLSGGNEKKKAKKANFFGMEIEVESEQKSAENLIAMIAQKARAVGIHLILATQRPSADVVTGLIKANIPTKIAFMTTNKVNSQIILDEPGAEELTGKGDMLFADPSHNGLQRLQGLYA